MIGVGVKVHVDVSVVEPVETGVGVGWLLKTSHADGVVIVNAKVALRSDWKLLF